LSQVNEWRVFCAIELPDVVRALVPEDSRIAVLSRYSGDVAGLPTDTTVALRAPDDEQEAIERIAALPSDGVDFLVVPRSAFEWLEQHPALTRYLRSRHCFVTRQELACELYELTAEPSGAARGALGAEASSADREPRSQTGTGSGVGGWLRRLLGRR